MTDDQACDAPAIDREFLVRGSRTRAGDRSSIHRLGAGDGRTAPAGTLAALDRSMQTNLVAILLGASLMTSACATESQTGAASGAVGGGLIGAALGGPRGLILGAALGSLFGYGVGRTIEEQDRREVAYALESDRPMNCQNSETGNYYEIEPTRTVMLQGEPCREFRMSADVDGQPREVYGTACRQLDGSWQIVNRDQAPL
jgi:surface antigen